MSDYLPSFIVEPVLRQARRLSRISTGEESPSFLPQVPDFQRWNPTRFWNTSPPLSIEEGSSETTVQSIARTIQLWTNQMNDLDVDPMPSPPLEPMRDLQGQRSLTQHDVPSTIEFPVLDPQTAQQSRPRLQDDSRTSSAHSLNPAHELATRSRVLSNPERGHSRSDPLQQTGSNLRDVQASSHFTPDGYVRRGDGSDALPEDDGMGPLRQRISAIWAGPGNAEQKSRLVHTLMNERHRASTQLSSLPQMRPAVQRGQSSNISILAGVLDPVFDLSDADLAPTFAPVQEPDFHEDPTNGPPKLHLGCMHYRRNVKMQCDTCDAWYTCRLCHDEVEDHTLPRRETKFMLCMLCNTPQRVSQYVNSGATTRRKACTIVTIVASVDWAKD